MVEIFLPDGSVYTPPHPGELHPDDWCWKLREYERNVPNKGLRRIQEVCAYRRVNREPIVCERDLGPATDFHAQAFTITAGTMIERGRILSEEYTVGQVMEAADKHRDKPLQAWVDEDNERLEDEFWERMNRAFENERTFF